MNSVVFLARPRCLLVQRTVFHHNGNGKCVPLRFGLCPVAVPHRCAIGSVRRRKRCARLGHSKCPKPVVFEGNAVYVLLDGGPGVIVWPIDGKLF